MTRGAVSARPFVDVGPASELEVSGHTCHLVGAKPGLCCQRGCGDPPTQLAVDRDGLEHHRCSEHLDDTAGHHPLDGPRP